MRKVPRRPVRTHRPYDVSLSVLDLDVCGRMEGCVRGICRVMGDDEVGMIDL